MVCHESKSLRHAATGNEKINRALRATWQRTSLMGRPYATNEGTLERVDHGDRPLQVLLYLLYAVSL